MIEDTDDDIREDDPAVPEVLLSHQEVGASNSSPRVVGFPGSAHEELMSGRLVVSG